MWRPEIDVEKEEMEVRGENRKKRFKISATVPLFMVLAGRVIKACLAAEGRMGRGKERGGGGRERRKREERVKSLVFALAHGQAWCEADCLGYFGEREI